jgi:hypothetical protein
MSNMSVALAVIQPNPIQQCRRCGSCCESVGIPYSPRELKRRYDEDTPYMIEIGTDRRDIRIIYPMLKDRCRGKFVWGEKGTPEHYEHYVYSCANLTYEEVDGQRLAQCSLHGLPSKPYMCSGYPFYGGLVPLNEPNPAYVKGCGYNLDAEAGTLTEEYERAWLWELEADDLE